MRISMELFFVPGSAEMPKLTSDLQNCHRIYYLKEPPVIGTRILKINVPLCRFIFLFFPFFYFQVLRANPLTVQVVVQNSERELDSHETHATIWLYWRKVSFYDILQVSLKSIRKIVEVNNKNTWIFYQYSKELHIRSCFVYNIILGIRKTEKLRYIHAHEIF